MRVIVLLIGNADDSDSRLDAQIRVGGDAGASEVVTLRVAGEAGRSNLESLVTGLLLPDAPVVVWWPNRTPQNISQTSIGRIAQRRITDAATKSDPSAFVAGLGEQYAPGDTDLAWTRLTRSPWTSSFTARVSASTVAPCASASGMKVRCMACLASNGQPKPQ